MTPIQAKIREWRNNANLFVREVFGVEPDAWQDDVLAECSKPGRKRIAMKACAGPGKAQPRTTMIPTPQGMRAMGDLRVGDEVFTADGSVTRVTGVFERGILPVYRVSFDDGSSTLACGEHLWKVRGRTERRHFNLPVNDTWTARRATSADGYIVISTEQIIQRNDCADGNRRQFEIPRQGAVQFPKKDLPIDPYVLGVWIGDGVRNKAAYATKPDRDIQDEIERRGYKTRLDSHGLVRVYGIRRTLRLMGILSLYSYEKSVPEIYLFGSAEQRRDLLCGLMDTDGGIDADGHMQFSSTSECLADNVVWLARSLGGAAWRVKVKNPFYYGKNGERINGKPCYRVAVRLPFNPFRVKHRSGRWKDPARSANSLRYMTRYIDSIESSGEADCICIAVEHNSRLYLTNDFIVTHNTALLAWEGWRRLSCYAKPGGEYPKGAAVAITNDNLRDNLWAELAKWQGRSSFLKKTFTWQKKQIYANDHPETWFLSARGYSKTADQDAIGRTLSGLHSVFPFYLIDESGDIPPNMLRSAEQGLTSCEDGVILTAGNTTSHEGLLYFACSVVRDQWFVVSITADPDDPKRTPRVDIEWARKQIELYGRDNPWVQAFILGQFPAASINAILSVDEVEAAMKRIVKPDQYDWSQKRLGIDVARFGDDRSVIFPRQGLKAFRPVVMRHQRTTDIAARVAAAKAKWGSEVELIDDTGHWGHGVIDNLLAAGQSPIGIQFHAPAINQRYKNRRAEMWLEMAEWIRRGGSLPNIPELIPELTAPTYTFHNGKFLLEDKDQIKQRIGRSPDLADALALTFAIPDQPKSLDRQLAQLTGSPLARPNHAQTEYNPFA